MPITRLNEFQARADKVDELREFLGSVVASIVALPGCQSSQLLQSHDNPARFVILEVWESVAAHQASVQQIPPDLFARIMPLLDGQPRGEYFHS